MLNYKFLFLLMILVFIIIYSYSSKNIQEPIFEEGMDSNLKIIHPNQPTIEVKKAKTYDYQADELLIKPELKSNFYSSDPIINSEIIETLYDECFMYFKDHDLSIRADESRIYMIKADKFFKNCEKINIEHPEFLLDNWELFSQQNREASSQSLLSKITKRYSKIKLTDNYDEGLKIIKQLKNENPNILLTRQLRYQLYDFYFEYYLLDIYTLLKTQNGKFVINILRYSDLLMACRLGAECGETSLLLLNYCYVNDAFCGLSSFEELIYTKLTLSQQHDIDLVVWYLEQLFEINSD